MLSAYKKLFESFSLRGWYLYMKTVFSHHFVYVWHFLLQNLPSESGRVDVTSGPRNEAPPALPLFPQSCFQPWGITLPPWPSTETCLPAQEGIDLLCSQSWLFCLAAGHTNFPVQTRSRGRSKCPGWVHGRNGTCAFKQEHNIPVMLPSHMMCARSMSSTTSANCPKFLNLNFCLASKIRSEWHPNTAGSVTLHLFL